MGKKILILILYFLFLKFPLFGQDTLQLNHDLVNKNQIIPGNFYSILEDPEGDLKIDKVVSPRFQDKFEDNESSKLSIENINAAYWVKIKLKGYEKDFNGYIEFIDSHIGSIEGFIPEGEGYTRLNAGFSIPFYSRKIPYKNFLFKVYLAPEEVKTIYFKINSDTKTSFKFKVRSQESLLHYSQTEYYMLGLFYGILAIMFLYNLIIYLFTKEKTYLYYIIYVLTWGLLFLNEDGLGFQYLWPDVPAINKFLSQYGLLLVLLAAIVYSSNFLNLNFYIPKFKKILLIFSLTLGIYFILFNEVLRYDEIVPPYLHFIFSASPFIMLYVLGVLIYNKGYKPAKYYLIAQSFVIIGLTFLILRLIGARFDFLSDILIVYSLNIAIVIEITILSYALGEKIRHYKVQRMKAQKRMMENLQEKQETQKRLLEQLRENEKLKDKLNNELEEEVERRAEEIVNQNQIIDKKNKELIEANRKLQQQAEEIKKWNQVLDIDNWSLKKNLKKLVHERVLSKEVTFEEFSQVYTDKTACLKFLAEVKWKNGYQCRKCNNKKFSKGKTHYSRRCTKCGYEESPTAFTLFHKCKFSIVKAFYLVYLMYHNNGSFSSVDFSKKVNLRQSTCWNFSKKIKKAIKNNGHHKDELQGWDHIIITDKNMK